MLIKIKDVMDKYMDEGYSLRRIFVSQDKRYTPLKYRGILEHIGYAEIWNDVGCVEETITMYRPVVNGTIIYDDEYKII